MSEFAAGIIKWILCEGGLTQRSCIKKAICLKVEHKGVMKKMDFWKCQRLVLYSCQKEHAVNSSLHWQGWRSHRWAFFDPSNCFSVQIVQIWDRSPEVCTAPSSFSSETNRTGSYHSCQHGAERPVDLFLGLVASMAQPNTNLLPINPALQITLKDVNKMTFNEPQIQSYNEMCFNTLSSIVVQARCFGVSLINIV